MNIMLKYFNTQLWFILFHCSSIADLKATSNETESDLISYILGEYEQKASSLERQYELALWNVETDIGNKTKEEAKLRTQITLTNFTKEAYYSHFEGLNPNDYKHNEFLKRQLDRLVLLGDNTLNDSALAELGKIEDKMVNTYSTAKICPYRKQKCNITEDGLSLTPDLENLLASSKDYNELLYIWSAWRNVSGAKIRKDYKKYVDLKNQAARLNGFSDYGQMWRHNYEDDKFIKTINHLWRQLKPLYEDLHTYVRFKLEAFYPNLLDKFAGLIPAHLTGNMWAQSWTNLYDLVLPYPNASAVDITATMIEKNYTVSKMFQVANEFYLSMGLPSNSICYNVMAGAMVEKPPNRQVVCHASAWDLGNHKDFRIKMCTRINQEDFFVIHHEMGHIQYYIQYTEQPIQFRTSPNPGFHEAIGDAIALSVSTPKHLLKIGLLHDYEDSKESNINALMMMALDKLAFLPFGYIIDKWRWEVFSGQIPESEWNSRWWHYREIIQKIAPPVPRSENDFDPGAKYHVLADSEYIEYFVASLLQFQIYRSLCVVAGEFDPDNKTGLRPLHKCDFYQSRAAGQKLSAGLKLGASRHWSHVLELMTGEKTLNVQALLEYFQPLHEYLKKENDKNRTDERSVLIIVLSSILGVSAIMIVVYIIVRRRQKTKEWWLVC